MGAEPAWLDPRTVVLIHYRQLAEHGGAAGIRDQGILQSSLAAPRQQYAYGEVDLYDLAACYGARIARNHPFADGNKRTAWVCTRLFLRLNGCDISAEPAEKLRAMLAVAAGSMSQPEFAAWLREQTHHAGFDSAQPPEPTRRSPSGAKGSR